MDGVKGLVSWTFTARFIHIRICRTPANVMTVSLSPTQHSRESRTVDHRTLEQAGLRRLPSVEVRPPLHLVDQGPQSSLTLCDRLRWLRPSVAECLSDAAVSRDDEVKEAVLAVWQICKTHLLEGTLDQLVLDEIGLAIELGYLSHEDVLSVLEQRPSAMDVIVTGPAIPAEMMEMADQVTELRRGF